MTTTFRQTVVFDAPVHAVFEALMDSEKHAAFTGAEASITRKVGGKFSAWDGYITGRNLRIEKDKEIVQSWRSTDFKEREPDSEITFRFSKEGTGTRLSFVHRHVPERLAGDLRQGWKDFYWTPLKAFLAAPRE